MLPPKRRSWEGTTAKTNIKIHRFAKLAILCCVLPPHGFLFCSRKVLNIKVHSEKNTKINNHKTINNRLTSLVKLHGGSEKNLKESKPQKENKIHQEIS